MAKAERKNNKIDLDNLSRRDRDLLTLDVQKSMKKYNLEKQGVYDRRFALNKKIKQAGLTVESLLNGEASADTNADSKPAAKAPVKTPGKRGRRKKEKVEEAPATSSRELMVIPEKQVPVVMKPIEINFDNFSVRLNGVPKRISVNPETNAIEIDL
jgi:hypothetical protein